MDFPVILGLIALLLSLIAAVITFIGGWTARRQAASGDVAPTPPARKSARRLGNPAVRVGVTYGLIVAAISAITTSFDVALTQSLGDLSGITDNRQLLAKVAPTLVVLSAISLLVIVVDVALYLRAGRSAARQTGTIRSGALAGLVTGLVAGVIGAALALWLSVQGVATAPPTSTTPSDPFASAAGLVIGGVLGPFIAAMLGAGLGALGGIRGRGIYRKAHAAVPTSA